MTRIHAALRLPLLIAFWAACASAHAQSTPASGFACVIVGNSSQSVRSATGATVQAPARLANCEGATVQSDALQVCFVNERRERRCREFKKGTPITRASLGAADSGGLAETVISMAKGDTRALAGQTRNNTRADGLPYGQVIGAGGGVAYDLGLDTRLRGARTLRLTEDSDGGATLWEAAAPAPLRGRIPLQGLKPDTWYRWVAEAQGSKLSGRFLLVGASAAAARQELQRIEEDQALNAAARLYLQAEVFNEAGLAHERTMAVGALQQLTTGTAQ